MANSICVVRTVMRLRDFWMMRLIINAECFLWKLFVIVVEIIRVQRVSVVVFAVVIVVIVVDIIHVERVYVVDGTFRWRIIGRGKVFFIL